MSEVKVLSISPLLPYLAHTQHLLKSSYGLYTLHISLCWAINYDFTYSGDHTTIQIRPHNCQSEKQVLYVNEEKQRAPVNKMSLFNPYSTYFCGVHGWLRHCAASSKVAGLIPTGVNGIFHWYNPSSCTMTLGLTQPLAEMSTRIIPWGGGVKAAGA
jgi:hypothetical protein